VQGTLLAGRYRLAEEIGTGGMGSVYRATDLRTDGTVAVKIPHPALASEPGYRERLRREARIAASLGSPRVVRVIDLDEHDGVPFLVMEYVAGETLQRMLARQGRLPLGDALTIATEVARALDAAYVGGIVHRDLKPQNVKLVDGQVKVLDFGIARLEGLTGLTTTGGFVGTPEYCAPEQAEGHADTRTDIYALGVMLYRMLAGQLPFRGPTALAMLRQHALEAPPKLSDDVPRAVRDIVERCMAKDPADRFRTPSELVAALVTAISARAEPPVLEPTRDLPAPAPSGLAARPRVARLKNRLGALLSGLGWLIGGAVAIASMRVTYPAMEWYQAMAVGQVGGGALGSTLAALALRAPRARADWLRLALAVGIGVLGAGLTAQLADWYVSQMLSRLLAIAAGVLLVWLAFRGRLSSRPLVQVGLVATGAAIGWVLVENNMDDIRYTLGPLIDVPIDTEARHAIGELLGVAITAICVGLSLYWPRATLQWDRIAIAAVVAAVGWSIGNAVGDQLTLQMWTIFSLVLTAWLLIARPTATE
jgi:serine/threonine-protein kinase